VFVGDGIQRIVTIAMSSKPAQKNQGQGKAKGKNRATNKTSNTSSRERKRSGGSRSFNDQTAVAAAYSSPGKSREPKIVHSKGSCRIIHRELVYSMSGHVPFTVERILNIQPGNSFTFPWLSIMAQGWEQYCFNSVSVRYHTRAGTSTPGSVIIAPDYDASDNSPSSEAVASTYQDTVEDAPWKDIVCHLRKTALQGVNKRHFVRTGSLPDNADIKLYDAAKVFLCSVDASSGNIPWGKVWIEYDIEFFVPQVPPQGGGIIGGGEIEGGGTITPANPLGTTPANYATNVNVVADGASQVAFGTAGLYLISFEMVGTGLTAITALGSPTAVVQNLSTVFLNGASTDAIRVFAITILQAGAVVLFTATATTVTASVMYLASAPGGSI